MVFNNKFIIIIIISPYLSTFIQAVDENLKSFQLFSLHSLICHSCTKFPQWNHRFHLRQAKTKNNM